MVQPGFRTHNVIAAYPDPAAARAAIERLRAAGVRDDEMSLLARSDLKVDDEVREHDEAADLPTDTIKAMAGPAAAGTAVGGLAGFLAGAIAFGIPGIGPAVGAGIWAATAGGGVAGATAGGIFGGISRFFDERYRDAVTEGQVLVGVHCDDAERAATAERALAEGSPRSLRRFDPDGRVIA